jgi:hypothetical protein
MHYPEMLVHDTTFFTYDSFLYRDRAIDFFQNYDYSNLSHYFVFTASYGLNYSSLSILFSFANTSSGFNDLYVYIFNLLLLMIIYILINNILKSEKITINNLSIILLSLFLYLPFSLIQINKEILGFTFIVIVMYLFNKRKLFLLLFIGMLFGLFRIQYLLIVILLLVFKRPNLFFILIIINIAVYIFLPPSLIQWSESQGGEVNSLELMLMIDNLTYTPLIGALGYLARIVISLFTGLYSPIKVILGVGSIDYIYHISIFLLSFLTLISIKQYFILKKYKMNISNLYYNNLSILYIFLTVNSIAPFLQPRYYLPIILLFLINFIIFNNTKIKYKVDN